MLSSFETLNYTISFLHFVLDRCIINAKFYAPVPLPDYLVIILLCIIALETFDRLTRLIKSIVHLRYPRQVTLRRRELYDGLAGVPPGEKSIVEERIRKYWNRSYPLPGNKYPKVGEQGNKFYEIGSKEAMDNATIELGKNIFAIENSDVWAAAAASPLDCSVGSLVRTEVPSLARQEDQHASLHNRYCRNSPANDRYAWFKRLLKFILVTSDFELKWINSCWEIIRHPMASLIDGMVESCFTDAAYLSQILLGGHFCRLLVFHWLEEGEHGVVTSKVFKKRFPITIRCIGFLLGFLALSLIWVIPLFSAFYFNLHLLMNPLTWPVVFLHLMQYLFVFACNIVIFAMEGLLFWVLPFGHPMFIYHFVQRGFQKEIEKYCISQTFNVILAEDSIVSC